MLYSTPRTMNEDTVKMTVTAAKKDFESISDAVAKAFAESKVPQPRGISESRMWEICQAGGWMDRKLKAFGIPRDSQNELCTMHSFVSFRSPADPWVVAVDFVNTVGNSRMVEFRGCTHCLLASMRKPVPRHITCICHGKKRNR